MFVPGAAIISNSQSSISPIAEQPLPKPVFAWEPGGEFHLLPYQPYLLLS